MPSRMLPWDRRISFLLPLALLGACVTPSAAIKKPGPGSLDQPWQGPEKTSSGGTSFARSGVQLIFPAGAPCKERAGAIAAMVSEELSRVQAQIGLEQIPVPGIEVIFHGDLKSGASKTRAFARWDDADKVSANFFCDQTFNEQTPLLRGLIPNELAKALMLATIRGAGRVKRDNFPSALAWIMEGVGTYLHKGGWFGVPPSDWAGWFLKAGLLYPMAEILNQDYRHAVSFNRFRTHTFNIIEFPQLGSFIEFLTQDKGPAAPLELLRLISADPIEATFNKVFDEPLAALEARWLKWLAARPEVKQPAPDLGQLTEVIRSYAAVLEVSARAATIDNVSLGPWAAKYGKLLSVMPILKLELDQALRSMRRAVSLLKQELSTKAREVERRLGLGLLRPFDTGHLASRGVQVIRVKADGPGARFGIQPGDELHLLDGDLGSWLDSTAPLPLRVVVTRSRKDVVLGK